MCTNISCGSFSLKTDLISHRITNHAASKFCPNCGNKALIRVKAVTDDQGQTRFTPLSIKQFSRRGLKVYKNYRQQFVIV